MEKMTKQALIERRDRLMYQLDFEKNTLGTTRATIQKLKKINTLIAIADRR